MLVLQLQKRTVGAPHNEPSTMKTITIHRNKGYYGRIRALKILVDDEEVAILKAGKSTTIEVPDSAGLIWGTMDWGKTESLDLNDVKSGQSVSFDAFFTFNPLRSLAIAKLPFRVYTSD